MVAALKTLQCGAGWQPAADYIAALPVIYLLSFANFATFVTPALVFLGVPSNQKVSRFGGFVS
jgi:hypothetical protein